MDPEKYVIRVEHPSGSPVRVLVDGEESFVDAFEFAAPVGNGLRVVRLMRVELVQDEKQKEVRPIIDRPIRNFA